MSLFSFDIFDTLITRKTATATGIFSLVRDRIEKDYHEISEKIVGDFAKIRIEAERVARELYCKGDCEDISLEQIYEIILTMTMLSDHEAMLIKKLELEVEYENSVAIWANIKKLKEKHRRGYRVVLISDMYLSSEDIRKLLVKHDYSFIEIPIYVSSEYGRTKTTGNLYRMVRRKEMVKWSEWEHLGDNLQSDVESAKTLGINALQFELPKMLECEQDVFKRRYYNSALQLFIGASRNVRIRAEDTVQVKLGTSYGAAVLMNYVLWTIGICLRTKVQELYFIARDGWILKVIADILIENLGYNIKTRYLYGSRSSWRLPEYLPDWVENKEIYEKSSADRKLLYEYLEQEIILLPKKIAFVEVHGDGVTQKCLNDFIKSFCDVEMKSFYYILEKDLGLEGLYRFTSNHKNTGCIIETLTRALHGRTIGYQKKGDRIEPVLMDDETKGLLKYGYDQYLNAVRDTVSEYVQYMKSNGICLGNASFGKEYYDYLVENEQGEIFNYICRLPLTNTIKGKEELLEFAPKPTIEQINTVSKTGWLKMEGWCREFSLRQMSDEDKVLLETCLEEYKNNCKKLSDVNRYKISETDSIKPRIALYGAGRVGRDLYKDIIDNGYADIVVWIDKIFAEKDGIRDRLENIRNYNFDQIVIGVKNRQTVYDIITDLIMMGCEETDVYWEDWCSFE